MKKLLAMVLVLTLILSMGALAFAVDPAEGYEDWSQVTIEKELTITNNGTVNPGETFSFTVGEGVATAPATAADVKEIDDFTITIAEQETTGTANIILPEFTQVGVYTYPIVEVSGTTAGMRYFEGTNYLKITVINNPEGEGFLRVLTMTAKDENGENIKVEAFENEYSAGDLTVTKKIEGNYADPNDEFEITVTVTPIGDAVINTDVIDWNTAEENVSGPDNAGAYTAVYTLKGNESFTIQNLPYDVTYTVEETDSGEYDVTYDDNNSGDFDAAAITTIITNTRETTIETGINLDNAPYVLILVGVAAGLVGFTVKRRLSNEK